jgi:hypothetical protein
MTYAHDCGAALAAISAANHGRITATAMGNISLRPDLLRSYLRHLDLSGFDIPDKLPGWSPSAREQGRFWIGFYRAKSELKG